MNLYIGEYTPRAIDKYLDSVSILIESMGEEDAYTKLEHYLINIADKSITKYILRIREIEAIIK